MMSTSSQVQSGDDEKGVFPSRVLKIDTGNTPSCLTELQDIITILRKDILLKDDTIKSLQRQKEKILKECEVTINQNMENARLKQLVKEKEEVVKVIQNENEQHKEEVKKQREANKRMRTFINSKTEPGNYMNNGDLETIMESIAKQIMSLCQTQDMIAYGMLIQEITSSKCKHVHKVDVYESYIKAVDKALSFIISTNKGSRNRSKSWSCPSEEIHVVPKEAINSKELLPANNQNDNATTTHASMNRPTSDKKIHDTHKDKHFIDKLSRLRFQIPQEKHKVLRFAKIEDKNTNRKTSELMLLAKRATSATNQNDRSHDELCKEANRPQTTRHGTKPPHIHHGVTYRVGVSSLDRSSVLPKLIPEDLTVPCSSISMDRKFKESNTEFHLPRKHTAVKALVTNYDGRSSSSRSSEGNHQESSHGEARKRLEDVVRMSIQVHLPNPYDIEKMCLKGNAST